ncbi:hypothetical protein GWK47_054646 [Chionoecetes opilio]|uniref:Uncharacterized protein n=1 Tax=Chionoecetes opilio TaxID=41210 RepID=A0A8J4Y061_CHIOP|nr:hypothetical protein GWK47_054646 [Chionoecetes opilio]
MEQLGVKHEGRMHTTRLKQRLLAHFPNMCAQHQGRYVLLAFNEDLGDALAKACELDRDLDAVQCPPGACCPNSSVAEQLGTPASDASSTSHCTPVPAQGTDDSECPGCSVPFLGPEATSSAPRTPRAFCGPFFAPGRLPGMLWGWLRLILPEGGVPCFTGEAYADLKEWWSKALKSRQRSHFRPVLGGPVLGSRLGLPKSSISSSSRTSRPPAFCFHELGVDRADGGARSGGLLSPSP